MKVPELFWRFCVGALLCLLILPSASLATGQGSQDEEVSPVGLNHPLYELVSAMGFDDARIMAVLRDPQINLEEALNRIIDYSEAADNDLEEVGISKPAPPVENDNVKFEKEELDYLNFGLIERSPEGAYAEGSLFHELAELGFRESDIRSVLANPGVDFERALHSLLNEELDRNESMEENLTPDIDSLILEEERKMKIREPPRIIVENHEAKLEEQEGETFYLVPETSGGDGTSVDKRLFSELRDLGFPKEAIITVLSEPGINIEEALLRLLENDPAQSIEEGVWTSPKKGNQEEVRKGRLAQSGDVVEKPDLAAELKSFGFAEDVIQEVVLIPEIDLDRAILILLNCDIDEIRQMHSLYAPKEAE